MDTSHGFSSGITRQKIALLIDFDNVILGIDDPGFDVEIVVNALRARGLIVMGRAYGDWYRHNRHRRRLMEQGIDLIETPVFGPIIKNSADMHMALDAFEIAHTQPHIDTFCIVSGDSDFLPLIKRLQSRDKLVIVIAGHKFTSELVRRNCNEYIAYENLLAESVGATEDVTSLEGAYQLLERTIATLLERDIEVRSSTVKQMMVQLNPAFSERTFGCAQFKQFLDRAARAGVVKLGARDALSGEFIVVPLNDALVANGAAATTQIAPATNAIASAPTATPEIEAPGESTRPRRGRRGRGEKFVSETPVATPSEIPVAETPVASSSEDAPIETTESATVFSDPHSILGRVPLRRGRLRFSAREGRTTVNAPDNAAQTPGEELPSAAEIVAAVEEITQTIPIEELEAAADATVENSTESDAPNSDVTSVETPTLTESEEAAAQVAAMEAASEKPTRKRTTRGGRKRKTAKSEEASAEVTAETDAPQVLADDAAADNSTPEAEISAVEVAPETSSVAIAEEATSAEPSDIDIVTQILLETGAEDEIVASSETSNAEVPVEEAEPKAKPRRAPRRRPAAKKAKSDAPESTPEAS